MKKYLIFAASVLLFMSCNKSDMKVYEGNYSVDSKTVITVNNRNVDISDFENASISISITDGDLCEVTLTNFITGQPEVSVPATISNGTKAAAGASFSGSINSGDRTISVQGTTADGTIASINIEEEITAEGIVGKWSLGGATVSFSHPDLEVLDLSGIIPDLILPMTTVVDMVNAMIMQSLAENPQIAASYIEFTSEGYIASSGFLTEPDMADILAYYVQPEQNIFGIYLRKSVVNQIFGAAMEDPDAYQILQMLGLTTLIENPQSISVPLSYAVTESGLDLTVDQNLTNSYLAMLSGTVQTIKAVVSALNYEDIYDILYSYDLQDLINEQNFPAVKELVIKLIDALTDGQFKYSATVSLVPFSE